MKLYNLKRNKSRQGDVVQRFGDFKKGGPTVLIPENEWMALGQPEEVMVTVKGTPGKSKSFIEHSVERQAACEQVKDAREQLRKLGNHNDDYNTDRGIFRSTYG